MLHIITENVVKKYVYKASNNPDRLLDQASLSAFGKAVQFASVSFNTATKHFFQPVQ